MATPPITQDEFNRRFKALCNAIVAGHAPPGVCPPKGKRGALAFAADACGLNRIGFSNWYHNHAKHLALPKVAAQPVAPIPPPDQAPPAEIRDATFWRKKAAALEGDLADTRHALREVAGLAGQPIIPPQWTLPSGGGKASAIGLLHISDTHVGEVVRPEEVNGLNRYDPDVFRARLKRLITAAVEITPRWASDCRLEGMVIALNGDLISGDIHDELRRTNALTSNEQVLLCVQEFAAAIRTLSDAFGRVWVIVTPGNHSRSTDKTHAKRTVALSYDSLIGQMLLAHFTSDARVVIHIAPGRDAVYPILGWNVFQTHGDTGSGGGKGFAGATLPIARNMRSVTIANAFAGVHYHIKLTAHYHTSANLPGNHLANGSVIGFNEYAMGARFEPEPPQQWMGLVHSRWGLRERCEIRLEEPAKPEAPRIRVQARSR